MAGVSNKRCKADEKLLDLYRTKGRPESVEEATQPSNFYILDCRGAMAATGNQVRDHPDAHSLKCEVSHPLYHFRKKPLLACLSNHTAL